jgi:hypothetical protein
LRVFINNQIRFCAKFRAHLHDQNTEECKLLMQVCTSGPITHFIWERELFIVCSVEPRPDQNDFNIKNMWFVV